ncbi:MAG TPA: M23 family metallopeptidase [Caldithrix abyssi]|uniref:M23 family metallopeptidase n=1 Tax=Caldithrix abyssi TaxID=187145 RepID=A0A7V4WVJ2_CALAY|nr:M23 family metallopeptidase [Caldithrix abyssi]
MRYKTAFSAALFVLIFTVVILAGSPTDKPPKFIKPTQGEITAPFGNRVHPVLKIERHHDGIDIKAPLGQPVYASAAGKVVFTGIDGGYGKVIKIEHPGGYQTVYAHLDKISVKEEQQVEKGDQIGTVGNTGISAIAQLHYEVRKNGKAIDPLQFIK